MLKNKFPPQLELISDYEINMGIRELSEGKFGVFETLRVNIP